MHRGEPRWRMSSWTGSACSTQPIAWRPGSRIFAIARGEYLRGLEIANRCLEACPDDVQFQTMKGFFLEQSGSNAEGLP